MLCRFHGAVHRLLQRLQIGDVDVVDVHTVVAERRRQVAQRLISQRRPELHLRQPGRGSGLRRRMFAMTVIFAALTVPVRPL